MNWRKQGLIFAPTGEWPWAQSYALLPTVELLSEDLIRVYFATLDKEQVGRMGFVDLDPKNPKRIIARSREPVLDLGALGSFDDSGVNPSCVVDFNDQTLMYYIGWQRCQRVPYMLFTGLATKQPDSTFRRLAKTPVLDRTENEPFSRAAPFVLCENGLLKMWYWSCAEWRVTNGMVHYYNSIRYATSRDGVVWDTVDHECIRPNPPNEYSVGRPCVIKRGDIYQMWYSIRSFRELYAIGYAESRDGIHWVRRDAQAGITISESGWDSEMICYPFVVEIGGRLYMFYNGNRHGSTGFGYATLES